MKMKMILTLLMLDVLGFPDNLSFNFSSKFDVFTVSGRTLRDSCFAAFTECFFLRMGMVGLNSFRLK